MKKNIFHPLIIFLLFASLFTSCLVKENHLMGIDAKKARENYKGQSLIISPMDDYVQLGTNSVTIIPKEEGQTYTISGYFDGQIVVGTKNTVIKLSNAFLENTSGQAALKCEAKAEVSSVKDSVNYIISRGRGFANKGALQARRGLVLGGSGSLYIKGGTCHGIEADEVKIKGSGILMAEGTKRGSALCCNKLTVEPEKTFTAFFINAKNGIKADLSMNIASGTFFIYDNETALKSDSNINLSGGVFHTHGNKRLYNSENISVSDSGAVFVEE